MGNEIVNHEDVAPRVTPEEIADDVDGLRVRLQASDLTAEEINWLCEQAGKMANNGWMVDGHSLARWVDGILDTHHRSDDPRAYERTREIAETARFLGIEILVRPGAIPPSPFLKLQEMIRQEAL